MRVLYDARWLPTGDRFDGVGRYSHGLAWAMSRQPDIEMIWLVHDERQLAKLPSGAHAVANDPQNGLEELFLADLLGTLTFDVIYSPFFMMGGFSRRYKRVFTVHDTIYYRHRTPPQWLPWHLRLGWFLFHLTYIPLRWTLKRADVIATVSDTARSELQAIRATKNPIITVKNAVSQNLTPSATNDPSLRYLSNDIVYMGSFTPYKNVETLIDALVHAPEINLHLLSKIPPKRRTVLEKRMLERGVTNRVIIHDGVTDETYRQILSGCRGLISASKAEGFGLPIIEAQQQGVPVACSDIPIFREIAGNTAKLFDPTDPLKCAAAMRYLGDPFNSAQLVEYGYQNAARFNWDDSGRIAVDICRRLHSPE